MHTAESKVNAAFISPFCLLEAADIHFHSKYTAWAQTWLLYATRKTQAQAWFPLGFGNLGNISYHENELQDTCFLSMTSQPVELKAFFVTSIYQKNK